MMAIHVKNFVYKPHNIPSQITFKLSSCKTPTFFYLSKSCCFPASKTLIKMKSMVSKPKTQNSVTIPFFEVQNLTNSLIPPVLLHHGHRRSGGCCRPMGRRRAS